MKMRIFLTLLVFGLWSVASTIFNSASTVITGQVAGKQFDNNDLSYTAAQGAISLSGWGNTILFVFGALVLAAIWYAPLRKWLTMGAVAIAVMSGGNAKAYYDKQDFTEAYFILPNESAFFIPDVGANKDSQAAFGSEEYLKANKIPAKRFLVPHAKLSGSGSLFADYYVPTGRLIIVDRSPFNREWVGAAHRGTSNRDESFPCQSKEGLNISVGIAIGASVLEENVAKFLYRFGVKPPQGDRSRPEVIFTSVFYGRSLTDVMDGPVRSKVQSLVCDEFTKRSFDEGNAQAAAIMGAIEKKTTDYLSSVGITLEYIGWADTFNFDHVVQDVINRRYVAGNEAEIAKAMAPHTATLQALASAEATRTIAGKWDGKAPTSVSLWWLPSGVSDFLTRAFSPSK